MTAQQPTCTVLWLPTQNKSAYAKWLEHAAVGELLHVPAARLCAAMSSNEQKTTCKLSCSSQSLFVVLNEAAAGGIDDRLLRKQLEVACHQLAISRPQLGQVQAALRCTDSDPGSGPTFYLPKKFRTMLSSSYTSLKPWSGPAAAHCMPLTDLPRKWEAADSVLYTDGSATPQTAAGRTAGHSIGAGVYCKDLGGRQVECRIDPAGQGATNTITRAELVAILQALQEVNGQPCVIATDSKASMHMIQTQLFNPSKLRNSPHSRLSERYRQCAAGPRSRKGTHHDCQGQLPHWRAWH